MKTIKTPTIDPEFKSLIPLLSDDEYRQLEENIIADGCRDALVTWRGILLDGHNRLEICKKHNLTYQITEKDFSDRDEAVIWIIANQFGRRNLQSFQRSELALKMKDIIAGRAKANIIATQNNDAGRAALQESEKLLPIHTDDALARMAGVSRDTIRKSETIIQKGTPEQKGRARKGGRGNTVNAIFTEIKQAENPEKKVCAKCHVVKDPHEFYPGRNICKACQSKYSNRKMRDFTGREIGNPKLEKELAPIVDRVIRDMYDTTREIIIPPDTLLYSVNSIVQSFIGSLERSRGDNPMEIPEECAKKIIAVLSEAETAINKMKGWLNHE